MSEDKQKEEDDDNDRLLADSFTALREMHSKSGTNQERASATRRAILLRATKERKRRAVVLRLVLPLAAVLAVSTAWAAATGRLPRVYAVVMETLRPTPNREPTAVAPLPSVATAPAPAPTTEPAPESSTSAAATASASASASVAVVAPPPPKASTTTSGAVSDREESLYRVAHEAHFVARDSSRALGAWDAYLATYPQGRFAPEARYNRALSLVRLNRRTEAKSALQPFADGKEVGGYRQREAKELLNALDE